MAQSVTAWARLTGSEQAWPIAAIDEGITTAAAAPWTDRAMTNSWIVGATPQATDATPKAGTPESTPLPWRGALGSVIDLDATVVSGWSSNR
jgi:hypothetical protein